MEDEVRYAQEGISFEPMGSHGTDPFDKMELIDGVWRVPKKGEHSKLDCEYCGRKIKDDFCPGCGAPVRK